LRLGRTLVKSIPLRYHLEEIDKNGCARLFRILPDFNVTTKQTGFKHGFASILNSFDKMLRGLSPQADVRNQNPESNQLRLIKVFESNKLVCQW
jgi:hypothetical protein